MWHNQHFIAFYGSVAFSRMDVPSLIIHASVDGYLGCFYLLALVNNDAMNIHVEVSVWVYVFSSLGFILRSGISRLPCNRVTVLRNCQTVCSVSTVLHSHQQLRAGSVLILTLADPCRLGLSDWNHANTLPRGSPCGSGLPFLSGRWYRASFHVLIDHPCVFFGKVLCSSSYPFKNWIMFSSIQLKTFVLPFCMWLGLNINALFTCGFSLCQTREMGVLYVMRDSFET